MSSTTPKKEPGSPTKEKSFIEKVTTLGRKKKKDSQDLDDLNLEGIHAIDSPGSPVDIVDQLDINLEEGEEIYLIESESKDDAKLKELMQVLKEWITEELKEQRIIIRNLEEDLHDGQILGNLVEKLSGVKLEVREVMQSEVFQKQKLTRVLEMVNQQMNMQRWTKLKWSVDSIHSRNLIAILHLLVALAFHFKAPIRIPEYVEAKAVYIQKQEGMLHAKKVTVQITATNEAVGGRFERDAFDTLFDHAPDKLNVVKKSLVTFANKHLNKLHIEVTDLDNQFDDGVFFILLMGLLEGYFVPLHCYHMTPENFEEKVHNVNFAFELMEDAGLPKAKARAEDVAQGHLKSVLRTIYNLFLKHKQADNKI
ncbi:putative beta-parvin-like isoform X3 [Apostichopus japonicus]|uniref:Putative beta-parvin-like isoform X3 n=1 Tax=Stichopus japonicus TaxID=307972 RepID=A0A2G8KUX0_STIJA|nr:putative beta-parvin-like isoform X3 [Apostichopus japonicus]